MSKVGFVILELIALDIGGGGIGGTRGAGGGGNCGRCGSVIFPVPVFLL